jgi:hypothetical protein
MLMGSIPDGYAAAKGWTCNFNTEQDWREQRLSTAQLLENNVHTKQERQLTHGVVSGNDQNAARTST